MKLVYNELYTNDNQCIPTLQFEYKNNNVLPNLVVINIDNEDIDYNIATLNFSYGLFDSFNKSTLEKLDAILLFADKFLNVDYINKNIWKPFLFTSEITIPPIQKSINSYCKNLPNYDNQKHYKIVNYYSNIECYENNKPLNFNIDTISDIQNIEYQQIESNMFKLKSNEKNFKSLKHKYKKLVFPKDISVNAINALSYGFNIRNSVTKPFITIRYECDVDSELSTLYALLDLIFSSDYSYSIKKCKYCDKFYITNKTDNLYCSRKHIIENKSITCGNIVSTLQKTHKYKQFLNKDKSFLNSLNSNKNCSFEYITNYINERNNIKTICFKQRDLTVLENFIEKYKINNPIY